MSARRTSGRGVGFELVKWGLRVAEQKGMVVEVEVQEKPRPFYQMLGFKLADTVMVRIVGDDESVALHVLLLYSAKLQAS